MNYKEYSHLRLQVAFVTSKSFYVYTFNTELIDGIVYSRVGVLHCHVVSVGRDSNRWRGLRRSSAAAPAVKALPYQLGRPTDPTTPQKY